MANLIHKLAFSFFRLKPSTRPSTTNERFLPQRNASLATRTDNGCCDDADDDAEVLANSLASK